MHIKNSLLRVAAAATVTAFLTVGGGVPAQAAMVSGDDGKASEQGTTQGDAGQQTADEKQAAADDKQAQGTENQPEETEGAEGATAPAEQSGESKAVEPAPSRDSKAQGPRTTDRPATSKPSGNSVDKSANGNGHTPVTVCHALGNGGFIEITFDENALEKHLDNHGDIYPVPSTGCPAPVETLVAGGGTERASVCHILGNGSYNLLTFDDSALRAHLAHGDHEATDVADCETAAPLAPADDPTEPDLTSATAADRVVEKFQVLGAQAERDAEPEVLGVQATANRAPAVVAPAAGILPATGAGDYALVLVGAAGLIAAGAALLARRRLHGDS